MTAKDTMNRTYGGSPGGFTLVEVLIALVVLSIGMLGIAALYLESLRASRSALFRTEAVTLAADIADRIRANRGTAETSTLDAYDCGGTCIENAGKGTIAIDDLNEWRSAIEAQLPGGAGDITFAAGGANAPNVYTIEVSWTEVGYGDPLTYQIRVEI